MIKVQGLIHADHRRRKVFELWAVVAQSLSLRGDLQGESRSLIAGGNDIGDGFVSATALIGKIVRKIADRQTYPKYIYSLFYADVRREYQTWITQVGVNPTDVAWADVHPRYKNIVAGRTLFVNADNGRNVEWRAAPVTIAINLHGDAVTHHVPHGIYAGAVVS